MNKTVVEPGYNIFLDSNDSEDDSGSGSSKADSGSDGSEDGDVDDGSMGAGEIDDGNGSNSNFDEIGLVCSFYFLPGYQV